jgi:uncharacterized protein
MILIQAVYSPVGWWHIVCIWCLGHDPNPTYHYVRGLDFTGPPNVQDDTPVIVVLHGLTGSTIVIIMKRISDNASVRFARIIHQMCFSISLCPFESWWTGLSSLCCQFPWMFVHVPTCQFLSFLTHCQGASVPITSSKLYTAGGTDDVRVALMYLSKRFPNAPLLGLGYSLGANIMTRYAAEEGRHCRLTAACVMANVCFVFGVNVIQP